MKPILLLSGPVGSGKTTVAREVMRVLPGPSAFIEGDTFWSFIVAGHRRRGVRDFRMIMASMVAAAVPYATNDHHVLVDFSIPPWFLEIAQKVVAVRGVPLDYVVLRPAEAICAARAAARPEGAIVDYSPYRDLYADFETVPQHTIENDDLDPSAAADRIRAGLEAGRFRLS